jgi:hypothetical protein
VVRLGTELASERRARGVCGSLSEARVPGLYGRVQLRRGCDATSDAISLNAS